VRPAVDGGTTVTQWLDATLATGVKLSADRSRGSCTWPAPPPGSSSEQQRVAVSSPWRRLSFRWWCRRPPVVDDHVLPEAVPRCCAKARPPRDRRAALNGRDHLDHAAGVGLARRRARPSRRGGRRDAENHQKKRRAIMPLKLSG